MRRSTPLVVLALVAVAVAGPVAGAQGTATVSIGSASVVPGGQVTVAIDVSDSPDPVAGYQVNVSFDPDAVRVTGVKGADFSKPIANIRNDRGWVFLAQAVASGKTNPTLARITFEATGEAGARTSLSFLRVGEDTSINNVSGETIPATYENGRISIGDGGSATTATGTPPPTTAPPTTAGPQTTAAPGTTEPPPSPAPGSTPTAGTPIMVTTGGRGSGGAGTGAGGSGTGGAGAGGTALPTPSPAPAGDNGTATTETPGQPGFTAAAAVLALGAALLARRR